MATFAIIPGGSDSPSSWALTSASLRELGHEAIAADLPLTNPEARWRDYVQAVADAVRGGSDVVIVAHSLGGFTAPLVCDLVPVDQLVLLAAMIPTPGALARNYWSDGGYDVGEFNEELFYHDLSPEARAIAKTAEREQRDHVMSEPSPLKVWPNVPTHYLLCRDDRVFPAETTRRLVRERLGITADEIDGGHMVYLSRPEQLAQRLHRYASARR